MRLSGGPDVWKGNPELHRVAEALLAVRCRVAHGLSVGGHWVTRLTVTPPTVK